MFTQCLKLCLPTKEFNVTKIKTSTQFSTSKILWFTIYLILYISYHCQRKMTKRRRSACDMMASSSHSDKAQRIPCTCHLANKCNSILKYRYLGGLNAQIPIVNTMTLELTSATPRSEILSAPSVVSSRFPGLMSL